MFEKFLLKILSYSFLLLGFYLLYIAFLKSNLWPGIVGGILIIAAMILLTRQKQGNS
jgi:membrane-bound ClpP family serine protease